MASRRPYNPTTVDESKINKKEPQTPIEEPKVEPISQPKVETKPEPKVEEPKLVPESIVDQIDIKINEALPCDVEISELAPNQSNDYLNIIEQFKQQDEPKIPVYNYSKDKKGNVKVQPKNYQEPVIEESDDNIETMNIPQDTAKKMIELIKENIAKAGLEVRIHSQLIKSEKDMTLKRSYESKLQLFKQELEYQIKKLAILEKMIK